MDRETGETETLKVPTTSTYPGEDIGAGRARLAEAGLDLSAIQCFVHGSTVGVNTIIQHRGAKVALFATAGFTDILKLAGLRMNNTYSLFFERPEPLVPREHVFPVVERMDAYSGNLATHTPESSCEAGLP